MNPVDFLELADEWAGGIREAEWRSAVSRAYYAAFHVARRLLQQGGFIVPDGDQAHAYVWLRLSNAGHPDVRQAGLDLNQLRSMRNRADYDLDREFLQPLAFSQVQVADTVIDLLQALAATPAILTQIIDAIKVYERDVLKQVTWQP
jgi:uncharacterized protein (UPF0332 family)